MHMQNDPVFWLGIQWSHCTAFCVCAALYYCAQ